jgi:hypothetical protein
VRALQDDADAAGDLDLALVSGAATVAQTTAGWAALTDGQANALGFANAVAGVHANGLTTRFDSELAQDAETVSLAIGTTTTGAAGAAEVQDVVISNLFTAVAGAGNDTAAQGGTLVVTIGADVYSVDVTAGDKTSAIVTALEAIGDDIADGVTFSATDVANTDSLTITWDANGAQVISSAVFTTNDTDLTGVNSTVVSDNVITGAAGNDTIVLGSLGDGTGADGDNIAIATARVDDITSNDIVVYSAAFGEDAIVHFQVDADATAAEVSIGTDFIDLTAIVDGYAGAGDFGVGNIDNDDSIVIADTSGATDTNAEILALYADTATAAVENHIYIRIENPAGADTEATVFHITDGTALTDATITELGTIHLIDASASWDDMTADNFVLA